MKKNRRIFLMSVFFMITVASFAQSSTLFPSDTLNRTIIELQNEVYEVKLNLHNAQKNMKTGILVATIGYSVTILGGQLLGNNPEVGKTLPYVGGATGIVGTVFLVNGFKKISLGTPSRPPNYPMH